MYGILPARSTPPTPAARERPPPMLVPKSPDTGPFWHNLALRLPVPGRSRHLGPMLGADRAHARDLLLSPYDLRPPPRDEMAMPGGARQEGPFNAHSSPERAKSGWTPKSTCSFAQGRRLFHPSFHSDPAGAGARIPPYRGIGLAFCATAACRRPFDATCVTRLLSRGTLHTEAPATSRARCPPCDPFFGPPPPPSA